MIDTTAIVDTSKAAEERRQARLLNARTTIALMAAEWLRQLAADGYVITRDEHGWRAAARKF